MANPSTLLGSLIDVEGFAMMIQPDALPNGIIRAFLLKFYAKIPALPLPRLFLGDRLMVGQQTLTLLILVRIQVSQPFDAPSPNISNPIGGWAYSWASPGEGRE